jgi:hypothetical protein
MTKHSFYTLIRESGKTRAKLVNGYSDGTFYYYKSDGGLWYAVHPLIGLSVATGSQRKYAKENAYTLWVQDALEKLYSDKERYRAMGAEFEKHINILKENNKTDHPVL